MIVHKIVQIFRRLYFWLGIFYRKFPQTLLEYFWQIRKGSELWVSGHGSGGAVVRKSSFDFRWFTKIGQIFHRLYLNIFWQIRKGSGFWVSWHDGGGAVVRKSRTIELILRGSSHTPSLSLIRVGHNSLQSFHNSLQHCLKPRTRGLEKFAQLRCF